MHVASAAYSCAFTDFVDMFFTEGNLATLKEGTPSLKDLLQGNMEAAILFSTNASCLAFLYKFLQPKYTLRISLLIRTFNSTLTFLMCIIVLDLVFKHY